MASCSWPARRRGLQAEDAGEGADEEDDPGATGHVARDVGAQGGEAQRERDEAHHLAEHRACAVTCQCGALAEPELFVSGHFSNSSDGLEKVP